MPKKKTAEPVVIRGSHSTRIEHPDGRVEFETHWDELVRDVNEALAEYAAGKESKPKSTRKKKVKED
jgi:hypothetical protein